ncbi:MAG: hypothetical protein DRP01_03835 [Archaeoglobales archaeon]|nr:MAG: hypothetical protein DRP01_03835 [Archaeoglobales archaeon]
MKVEGLEKLHRITFSIPSAFTSFAALATILIVANKLIDILRFSVFSIALAISIPILNVKFDLKKFMFLLTFFAFSIVLMRATSDLLKTNPVAGIFVSFTLLTVLYFTSESNLIEVTLISSLISLSISTTPLIVLGVLMGVLFVKVMDREFDGFNMGKYFKGFLLTWLTDDPRFFEDVLKERSVEFEGWVKCMRFGDARLITTSFHPGPMRNVGGARLVCEINSMDNTFYIHSPTNHALDPVSREEVERIMRSVDCRGESLLPMKPYDVEGERYVLRVFPFDKVKLMFIVGKECIDDLPYDLNVDGAVVVDSHSAYCKDFEPDILELKSLIDRGLNVKCEPCKLRYAFKKFNVETKSMCGVAVLILDYCNEKHVIVIFDGNNVDLKFRREIEDFCKKNGFKAVVASTDNHSKTGISTKFTYLPVGYDKRDNVIFEILRECFKLKTEDCEVKFSKRDVTARVVGEEFCKFISHVDRSCIWMSALYLTLLTTSFLLSLLIRFI